MRSYNIGLIPGDGIGPEVTREGVKVLNRVAQAFDFKLEWNTFPFSADTYLKRGVLVTPEEFEALGKTEAIYLGAMGDPRVPEKVIQVGGLLNWRFSLRPVHQPAPDQAVPGRRYPAQGQGPGRHRLRLCA